MTTGRVTLSSVHRVKGLEWDHVLVVGVDRNLLPTGWPSRTTRSAGPRRSGGSCTWPSPGAASRSWCSAPPTARPPSSPSSTTPPPEAERTAAARTAQVERLARISRERSVAAAVVDDSPETARLVDALKTWRSARAHDDGHPAYVVLSDAHLHAIAAARPTSLSELARCPGIGPTKLDRYGEAILDVIEAATEGAA